MGFFSRLFGHTDTPDPKKVNDALSLEERQDRLRRTSSYLASHSVEQSDAIQQTLTSVDEIRTKIAQTDNHVSRSLALTEETYSHNDDRMKVLERLQRAMTAIKESNQPLIELQASFHAIHGKTRRINDIVSKTQLLSFNASIEAARAGQFGKGFSVVAEEVGRLAQSSGEAAKQIEALVSESEIKAMSIVDMIVAQADEGVSVTRDVKRTFSEMVDAITQISMSLSQISQSSREQTIGIDRVVHAIERINQASLKSKRSVDDIVRLSQAGTEDSLPMDSEQINHLLESFNSSASSSATFKRSDLDADDPSFKIQD